MMSSQKDQECDLLTEAPGPLTRITFNSNMDQ